MNSPCAPKAASLSVRVISAKDMATKDLRDMLVERMKNASRDEVASMLHHIGGGTFSIMGQAEKDEAEQKSRTIV